MLHRADFIKGFSVCVGGVPGVGKSLLLAEHCRSSPSDVRIEGSTIVKAVIEPATVEDFDRWPAHERAACRADAIGRLEQHREATAGRLLVSGHFALRNRVSGVLESVVTLEDKAFYDSLFLVEASPAQILEWRRLDTRVRRSETITEIADHMEAERVEALRWAAETGVALRVVRSADLSYRRRVLREHLNQVCSL